MARIKTTLALSVLAHAAALASVGVLLPDGVRLAEEALTPVELVSIHQGARETAPVPLRKIEQVKSENKPAEAKRPEPEAASAPVEEVKREIRPDEIPAPAPVAAQRAAAAEPAVVHKQAEALPSVADAALKVENDPRPAKTSPDLEAAFNSYVIQKIDRAKLYPNWARQRGYEGNVLVRFKVGTDGSVSDIKVVRPCECDILNKAACDAIQRAAPFNDGPVSESRARVMEVNIGFKLKK